MITNVLILNVVFQDPKVERIEPAYGPMSGGSLITIIGQDLNTGVNIVAKIGNFECHIKRSVNYFIHLVSLTGILKCFKNVYQEYTILEKH